MDDHSVALRRQFIRLGGAERELLSEMAPWAQSVAPAIAKEFYDWQFEFGWRAIDGPPTIKMPLDSAMLGRSLVRGSTYWSLSPDVFQSWDRFQIGTNRTYDLHFTLQPGNVAYSNPSENFVNDFYHNLPEQSGAVRRKNVDS